MLLLLLLLYSKLYVLHCIVVVASIIAQSLTLAEGWDDTPRLKTAQTWKPSNLISTSGRRSFFLDSQNLRIWGVGRWKTRANVQWRVSPLKAALPIHTITNYRWHFYSLIDLMLLLTILFLPPALCSQVLSSKISTNGGKFCWTGVCFGNVTKDFIKKPLKKGFQRHSAIKQGVFKDFELKQYFERLASAHRPSPTSPSRLTMSLCHPLPSR